MAGYFAVNFNLTFQPYDAGVPVLLDWDEPQVNTEDQTIGFQIWKKGPSDATPQLIWTIDAAPDVGEGLENPSSGGNLLDADFPANATGSYTYSVCAFDSEGNFSGSADGSTADSGMCYNPATLTLTVKSGS